ncbi:ribosomal protein S18-alanine N-acetyltransferase [Ruminococcaceae bacterium OttesenSCG-928-L11]|nr:ribosomal protein S18-alanine N-acetyltransferase [Ruminococcaceae bacterium OttesenSCG-928-L11]
MAGSEISIAPMTEETVASVARLEQACFSHPWSLSGLQAELSKPESVFLTASIAGEIAGYTGIHHILDEGYITNVAVFPQFRRQGVATALMEAILAYGSAHQLAFITLEVRVSNHNAIALYEKLGFTIEGTRKRFYQTPTEDALIMSYFLLKKKVGKENLSAPRFPK